MTIGYYHRDGSPAESFVRSHDPESPDYFRVAETEIGDVRISTVFICLDHRYGDGPPIIFETMVFGGKHDEDMDRYSTEAEALAGHERWVARIRSEP